MKIFLPFLVLAGVIHFYIFVLESLFWGRPKTNLVFGLTPEGAEQNRLFAFNQGFYNLFLAVGEITGVCLLRSQPAVGATLIVFSSCSMLGAAFVLLVSQPKLIRAVLVQGLPPLLGLVLWGLAQR